MRSAVIIAAYVGMVAGDCLGKDLSCSPLASSKITWDSNKNRWEDNSEQKSLDDRFNIKVVNVGSGTSPNAKPALVGNGGSSDLTLVGKAAGAYFYAEQAPIGNIMIWTLIEANSSTTPKTDTLISTKAYNSFGPVTYTSVYSCK